MSTSTGSILAGYMFSYDAYLSAPTTGIETVSAQGNFEVRQNFPNPCTTYTRIPVALKAADVRVTVITTDGREVIKQVLGNLSAGDQTIDLDVSMLTAGNYVYSVKTPNVSGTFKQSKLFIKL